jgi:hypothetical protein
MKSRKTELQSFKKASSYPSITTGGAAMKSNVRKRSMSLPLVGIVILALAFFGIANAQNTCTLPASTKGWSALDKVNNLTKALTSAGFTLEQGHARFHDFAKDCCQQILPTTLFNNPWPNGYVTIGFGPEPYDMFWNLRDDAAIVLVGQTPPAAAYFSYQTILKNRPDNPNNLGIVLGDTTNIGTVRTIGPDRVNRPIVYIITGNGETERRMRAAALKAGYPDAIINVETIAPVIAPLGDGEQAGSTFYFAHRIAVPERQADLECYVKFPPYAVFRATPNVRLAADPKPVPVLRPRGTGHTEMDLYPALQRLRDAILNQYGNMPYKELDTKVFSLPSTVDGGQELISEKPYVGLQRGILVAGATRDTNYLASYPNFMLREDENEFVIVYGVNHQKTGKVTYSSVSIYADKDRWFGLQNGTVTSPSFEGSANPYLPGDPEADMLYVVSVARNCNGVGGLCMQVDQPTFIDINGDPYTCSPPLDLNQAEMFFLWRSYMEPATKVSPDDNELLYDRAIYFGPYFNQ